MTANILIIKKKGHNVKVKVTRYINKGYVPDSKMVVNLDNYKDVALFLFDLKYLYGVKIDQAIKEYQSKKDVDWLF